MIATKKKVYPIVEILWLDAEADPAWKTEQEVKNEQTGCLCLTVGLLVRRPNRGFPMYVVAGTATMASEPHFNNTMKIPKHWVKSITVLKEYTLFDEPIVPKVS